MSLLPLASSESILKIPFRNRYPLPSGSQELLWVFSKPCNALQQQPLASNNLALRNAGWLGSTCAQDSWNYFPFCAQNTKNISPQLHTLKSFSNVRTWISYANSTNEVAQVPDTPISVHALQCSGISICLWPSRGKLCINSVSLPTFLEYSIHCSLVSTEFFVLFEKWH